MYMCVFNFSSFRMENFEFICNKKNTQSIYLYKHIRAEKLLYYAAIKPIWNWYKFIFMCRICHYLCLYNNSITCVFMIIITIIWINYSWNFVLRKKYFIWLYNNLEVSSRKKTYIFKALYNTDHQFKQRKIYICHLFEIREYF